MSAKWVNLALQGGGSHGAFTWGVLDRLLEDGRLRVEAVSGTSAGAMNAVVMADGLMRDGADGARERLRCFWEAVGRASMLSPFRRSPVEAWFGSWTLLPSPAHFWFDVFNRVASPYQTNPLNLNPLQRILEDNVDFDRVRACDRMQLFVSATNVETGRVRVFHSTELTPEMVMASACLPHLFQAVEIDGVPYWDGGFMGNPVLFPFHGRTRSHDVVIVQINPIERRGTPRTSAEIVDRMNEITFNSSLLKELRAIDFVRRLIEQGRLSPTDYTDVHVHLVEGGEALARLGASSKLNAEPDFIEHLHDIGREAAAAWLEDTFPHLGERSTVDVRALFQGTTGPVD